MTKDQVGYVIWGALAIVVLIPGSSQPSDVSASPGPE